MIRKGDLPMPKDKAKYLAELLQSVGVPKDKTDCLDVHHYDYGRKVRRTPNLSDDCERHATPEPTSPQQ